jgi:hypothetical protein
LESGPLSGYKPYTSRTGQVLQCLSVLKPKTLAVMYGSSFRGNSEQALQDLGAVIKEAFDHQEEKLET